MKLDKNSASARIENNNKKNRFRNLKTIKGYAEVQHFYKSALKYNRNNDVEASYAYELGYN